MADRNLNETPTAEPAAKVAKVLKRKNVKQSLKMNQSASFSLPTPSPQSVPVSKSPASVVNQSTSVNVTFYPSAYSQIQIPSLVPPWGGDCILEGTA